jgi:tungstate transport system substrate-binding protein
MRARLPSLAFCITFLALLASSCGGDDNELILGATTSVQDPGLLDQIVRAFEDVTDYHVKPSVGGSGEVLEKARRGELDVIMTHSPADEDRLIADGEGLDKRPVMRNLFLVAGPEADPAGVRSAGSMSEAFKRISEARSTFISRGDQSGTHKRELSIWAEVGITPQGEPWYQESTSGQGQNIIVASDKGAYTLVDSSTFTVFEKRVGLRTLLTDTQKPNIYSVIRVAPDKHQNVNAAGAIAFAEFITSPAGQCIIADFGIEEYAKSLFEPAAGCPTSNVGG